MTSEGFRKIRWLGLKEGLIPRRLCYVKLLEVWKMAAMKGKNE